MRNKKKLNPLFKIFILVSSLLFITVVIAIGMFYYVFGITEPEGLSLALWPERFTDNFSVWMENDNGKIRVKEIGLERLDEYGLRLQVIDETGKEVFCYNYPENYPARYAASELISIRTSDYGQGNTIFADRYENSGGTWSYLIGFPYAIGKHMLYYNGENVGRLSKHLGKISKGISNVSMRCYTMLPEKGVFGEIYGALNKMDTEIRLSDKAELDTERIRREWIANITQDLKTLFHQLRAMQSCLWIVLSLMVKPYRNAHVR
ncbi:MAG: hypothetical protein K2P76_11315 [Lachnospiraceae bacterium]|nr:hypothetical protein [Lachnospiraceae bacterium]MDE6981292.1 hypothetical protein [Lachnospiraceae bacterium]